MSSLQIIFSGVGGQGLMVAGNILGRAAVEKMGLYAAMSSAYGVETRGTFTKSDIIISEAEIDFPEALDPDVVLALDPIAYQRYASSLSASSLLVVDTAFAGLSTRANQLAFPIAALAKEAGNAASANVVALGLLLGLTEVVSYAALQGSIASEFAGRTSIIAINLKALDAGLAAVAQSV